MNKIIAKFRQIYDTYPQAVVILTLLTLITLSILLSDKMNAPFLPTPYEVVTPPQIVDSRKYLSVVSVDPASGPKQSFETFMVISITFSEPLDASSVAITSVPNHNIGFKLKEGSKHVLQIFPKDAWIYDKAIQMEISAKGLTGNFLKAPFVYSQYLVTPPDAAPTLVY